VWSPTPPTSSPSTSPWRGSSPPQGYGFVEVALVSLSLCASLIRSVWAASHDYGHRCNSYVVDLFYELLNLRLQLFLLSYLSRCILCTPFLFASFDQSSSWERVWGDGCISWSNGGWLVLWKWQKFSDPLRFC
jgi:hypothetical protein